MEDRFGKLMGMMFRRDYYHSNEVYHYTGTGPTKGILRDDCVTLWMTHIDNFEDAFEGKTIEVFYDLALEKLKKEGLIDDSVYNQLCEIDIPKWYMFYFNMVDQANTTYCTSAECDVFVSCFCEDGNSEYMMERYIGDEDKKGYVIGAYALDLAENHTTLCFGQGHRFEFKKILYGTQIVEAIETFIKELLSIYDDIIDIAEAKSFIRMKLSEMRYIAKLARYSNEKEVRLILMVPKGDRIPKSYEPKCRLFEIKGKKYAEVNFEKSIISGIRKSKTVSDEEYFELLKRLKEQGYHLR